MKEFILKLTENYSNQIYYDLKEHGLEIIWVSNLVTDCIAVKSDKSKVELESHYFIDTANESIEGEFNCYTIRKKSLIDSGQKLCSNEVNYFEAKTN
ncbi:hypothetical protein QTG56_24125 (plasmid) [Rossellomorea sp. AcN35-11]|nr:hypothetical protein [Rossellomorea aquimaris]WJV31727.1 hypothetical protein QTG56_24125 [Rossellomorea sp. AcN35-11]